jgi:hypothetical protein
VSETLRDVASGLHAAARCAPGSCAVRAAALRVRARAISVACMCSVVLATIDQRRGGLARSSVAVEPARLSMMVKTDVDEFAAVVASPRQGGGPRADQSILFTQM